MFIILKYKPYIHNSCSSVVILSLCTFILYLSVVHLTALSVTHDRMIVNNELQKYVERSGRGLISGIIPEFAWRD
jgi:hypothetical protein